ncbi:MAG: YybH family protein [Bacillota bacterium]
MKVSKKSILKLLAVVLSGAAAAGVWAADPAADVSALQILEQSWVHAHNAGDADAITALYADDATLMAPGAPGASGKDAIHKFYVTELAESQHSGYIMNITGTPEGGVSGDWGWLSGAYSVIDKAGHAVGSGKFLSVFKLVDGKWCYVRDLWSSDGAKK